MGSETALPFVPSAAGATHRNDPFHVSYVALDAIDVPPDWREVDEAQVGEIAASMREVGLLQTIGVWPRDDGRFTLVWGRHRVLAAARLGWEYILGRRLEVEDDDHRRVLTNIENLRRSPLRPAEVALALKQWHDWYLRRYPESAGVGFGQIEQNRRDSEARRDGREPPERTTGFADQAAEETGKSPITIRRLVRLAARIGEEALGILARFDLSERDLGKLAAIRDEEARRRAVTLCCAGVPVQEAILEVLTPPGTPIDQPGTPDEPDLPPLQDEAAIPDEVWCDTYCIDVLKRLRDPRRYRRDALLYRHTRVARDAFRAAIKRAAGPARADRTGPYRHALSRAVDVEHPSSWLPCGTCQGAGTVGNMGECGDCKGHGYHLQFVRARKREPQG